MQVLSEDALRVVSIELERLLKGRVYYIDFDSKNIQVKIIKSTVDVNVFEFVRTIPGLASVIKIENGEERVLEDLDPKSVTKMYYFLEHLKVVTQFVNTLCSY